MADCKHCNGSGRVIYKMRHCVPGVHPGEYRPAACLHCGGSGATDPNDPPQSDTAKRGLATP